MLNLLKAGAMALALSIAPVTEGLDPPGALASGPIVAANVPQGPVEQQGEAAAPVFFLEQKGIDAVCGGTDQIIACAMVGGGPMALPNPCQERFRGESYAAVVCHEKSHTLGWRHG